MSTLTAYPVAYEPETPAPQAQRPWLRRFGTYLHLYIVAGITLPIMIYLAVMQTQGWNMPVLGLHGLVGGVASGSQDLYLYDASATRSYLGSHGGNGDFLLNPWRDYFSDRKLKVSELQSAAQIKKLDDGVLILPSAVALSADERREILAFRARGGAVLSTWATGTRNDKGDWEGWQFLQELGVKVTGEIRGEPETNHLILNGESPVSYTLPAGQRIFMSTNSETLLAAQGDMIAARFMNWARTPKAERLNEGAVLYTEGREPTGRAAYFAFAESAWSNHPAQIYTLFDDTLHWLQRTPAVVRAAWPQGKRAASVIEMDTEEGFPNAPNFAGMMQAAGHPATFFVLTSVGKKFPDVLRKLNQSNEIGYHGDIHISFKDQPDVEQNQRISNMRAEMSSVILDTRAMLGFRAPTEGYDATTEKLLQSAGLRYHVADPNRGEGRLPRLAQVPGVSPADDLIVLPRTQRDDINLLNEKLSTDELTRALITDAQLALDNGAMALLSVHTQNYGSDSSLYRAMPGFLLHIKQLQDRLWLTRTGDVAAWWRERERVRLSTLFAGRRLEFAVSVVGKTPVEGATFTVVLPQKDAKVQLKSTKTGGLLPTVVPIDAYRVALIFRSLPPGNYAYQMTFGS